MAEISSNTVERQVGSYKYPTLLFMTSFVTFLSAVWPLTPLVSPESERGRDRQSVKKMKGEIGCKKWKDIVVVDRLINWPINWAISGVYQWPLRKWHLCQCGCCGAMLELYLGYVISAIYESPLYHIVVIVRLISVHKRSLSFRCPISLWLLVLCAMTIAFNPISGSPYMFWAGCVMWVKVLMSW